ncbi:MAG: hypothetical protein AB7Y46_16250, partial [Armatimonadota bacterium]
MSRLLVGLLVASLCLGGQAAENLIVNPRFAEAEPEDASAPAGWDLPAGGGWARTAQGGPEGGACLRWRGDAGVVGPVRQQPDFLPPGTGCRIEALLRGDGTLRPAVRVINRPDGAELALASAAADRRWQRVSA